jgi:hypothetical protein
MCNKHYGPTWLFHKAIDVILLGNVVRAMIIERGSRRAKRCLMAWAMPILLCISKAPKCRYDCGG